MWRRIQHMFGWQPLAHSFGERHLDTRFPNYKKIPIAAMITSYIAYAEQTCAVYKNSVTSIDLSLLD